MVSVSAAEFRFDLLTLIDTTRASFLPSKPYNSASANGSSGRWPIAESKRIPVGRLFWVESCIVVYRR